MIVEVYILNRNTFIYGNRMIVFCSSMVFIRIGIWKTESIMLFGQDKIIGMF